MSGARQPLAAWEKEIALTKRLVEYGLSQEQAVDFTTSAKKQGLLKDYTIDELMEELEREKAAEQEQKQKPKGK